MNYLNQRNVLPQQFLILFFSFLITFTTTSQAPVNDSFHLTVEGKEVSPEDLLSMYIQHKSLSGEEKKAGEWLKSICLENGLNINQFGNSDGNYNFAASLIPLSDSLPNIIFLNHIDTVDEGDSSLWKYPPYSGHISQHEIWGRGAFDNKGAAIMQLCSILKFKSIYSKQKLPYNVTFLAVSCEETMCNGGIKFVLENHLRDLNPVTVIGEGATELNTMLELKSKSSVFGISIAHKRPLWIELSLKIPTSGHSSVTPLAYANKEMTIALANLIKKKPKIIFIPENKSILKHLGKELKGLKGFVLRHPSLFKPILISKLRKEPELISLFNNTITITSINSNNDVINKVSQNIKVTLDCRLLPEHAKYQFLSFLRKSLKNDQIRINVIDQMKSTPISCADNNFYIDMETAIQSVYPEAKVFPILLPNFNDVGLFRKYGVEGFSIIPVSLNKDQLMGIHGINERLPIKAVEQGINVYFQFMKNASSEEPIFFVNKNISSR